MTPFARALELFQRQPEPRVDPEEGTKYCYACDDCHPLSAFYMRFHARTGQPTYSAVCREVQRKRDHERKAEKCANPPS